MAGGCLKSVTVFLQLTWAVVVILPVVVSADISITVMIQDEVDVHCYSFANGEVQRDFGNLPMKAYGTQTLQLPILDATISNISCHFLWAQDQNSFQWFPVYESSGSVTSQSPYGVMGEHVAPCYTNCAWTVDQSGFLVLNTAENQYVLVHHWSVGDDSWIPPHARALSNGNHG